MENFINFKLTRGSGGHTPSLEIFVNVDPLKSSIMLKFACTPSKFPEFCNVILYKKVDGIFNIQVFLSRTTKSI